MRSKRVGRFGILGCLGCSVGLVLAVPAASGCATEPPADRPESPESPPSDPPAPPPGSVRITSDWTTFGHLAKPYGKLDEPGLGGFEYLLSSKTDFDGNDQFLNVGDESLPGTAIGADLGVAAATSGIAFDFSIAHAKQKHYAFRMTNTATGASTVLCWGIDCPAGSKIAATLDGKPPLESFNGLQLQVRAQDVPGASTTVTGLKLTGLSSAPGSDPFFRGTVVPTTPSTIPIDPPGRVGQWILGTDLAVVDWELSGVVTLSRSDGATSDTSKVRFVVDFVHDTRLPLAP